MRSRGNVFECEQLQELVGHQEVRYCYMELICERYPTSSPTDSSLGSSVDLDDVGDFVL